MRYVKSYLDAFRLTARAWQASPTCPTPQVAAEVEAASIWAIDHTAKLTGPKWPVGPALGLNRNLALGLSKMAFMDLGRS